MKLQYRMKITFLLFIVLLGLAGCTSGDLVFDAQSDLRTYRHIYVQSSMNDSNHLDQLIANELVRLGYDASAGVRTMMPDNTKLFITYETQWNWDFHTYLMVLEITARDVSTEKQIGHARIYHGGVANKSPDKMVIDVLKPIFGPKPPKK